MGLLRLIILGTELMATTTLKRLLEGLRAKTGLRLQFCERSKESSVFAKVPHHSSESLKKIGKKRYLPWSLILVHVHFHWVLIC